MIRHVTEEEFLAHYGILRKSGRYPWGSGGTQSARNASFLQIVRDHEKNDKMSEKEIADGYGMTINQLRALKSIAGNQQRQERIRTAQKLQDKGMSVSAIGRQMGLNESTVRGLLAPGAADKADILLATADMLRRQVDEKGFVDVGSQVELDLPLGEAHARAKVSATKFNTALAILQEEGYMVHPLNVEQVGTGKNTKLRVLAKPGTTQKQVWENRNNIRAITEHSEDGGRSYLGLHPPLSISSKRVGVNWAEDGGATADGVIYVRPGVPDISMGHARYAQVRIAIDGTHYLKGMAVYKDDLPEGVDLLFNTNKPRSSDKLDAMKAMKDDPDNPFGAVVRQRVENGKVTSALNIVGSKEGAGEEGSWDTWSKSLPAQMLSKQHPNLAKAQLAVTRENRQREFDEISSLTNPLVKRKLLEEFADGTDSAAVHLAAAAMPRQATKVLLPVNAMKPGEIYAPSFKDGDRVALVRFPHGGTFEIPQLTVNNRVPAAKKLLGTAAKDAVGIHHSVAERLSGADFDGDTVLVIPNNQGKIKSTPPLEGLKGFDPKASFGPYDGMRTIDGGVYNAKTKETEFPPGTKKNKNGKGREMGGITNLIADMTVQGASNEHMARAIRHSMVVIDAEKHHLDYKASEKENGIRDLKVKYQGGANAGAKTLITRATAETRVKERKQGYRVDPVTGAKIYTPSGRQFKDKSGKLVDRTTKSKKLAEEFDAHNLIEGEGSEIERVYADHSNALKAMANEARKEMIGTELTKMNASSKKAYAAEVESLNSKLEVALRNAPRERQAQVFAQRTIDLKRQANPDMDPADLKKIKNQALAEARVRTGASKTRVQITDAEWNAIQAGAVSNNTLDKILRNADMDVVRQMAMPRKPTVMTSVKQARAKQMLATGFTQAQIAEALGVNLSTLKSFINEE